jgi:hypothetical protein
MNVPTVQLTLDALPRHYRPGDRLAGRFQVDASRPWPIRAAELSVLWYTAGKGEEDFAIHHFERWVDELDRPLELRVPRPFSIVLPSSPLSYEGQIVKICWCARLRLFLPQGQESVHEVAFHLGDVPPAVEA